MKKMMNNSNEHQNALNKFDDLLKVKPDFYETGDIEKIKEFEEALDTLVPPEQN